MISPEVAGVIRSIIENRMVELNVAIPCVVDNVISGNRVDVEIAIDRSRVKPDGTREYEKTPVIENIFIAFNSTKSGFVRIPVKKGDRGYLVFSDYNIENWSENDAREPHTSDVHHINDCWYIPTFAKSDEGYDHSCTEIGYGGSVLKICDGRIDANVPIYSMGERLRGCC